MVSLGAHKLSNLYITASHRLSSEAEENRPTHIKHSHNKRFMNQRKLLRSKWAFFCSSNFNPVSRRCVAFLSFPSAWQERVQLAHTIYDLFIAATTMHNWVLPTRPTSVNGGPAAHRKVMGARLVKELSRYGKFKPTATHPAKLCWKNVKLC